MSYICIKKVSLSGKRYFPGDSIPDDAFIDGSAAKLIKYEYVAEVGEQPSPEPVNGGFQEEDEPVLSVVFTDGETCASYPVNTEQLQAIANTMSKTASDASAAIKEIGDESVLVFILKVDSRKAVREAAEKRLASLYEDMGASDSCESGAAPEATEGNPGQTPGTTAE